MKSITKLTMAAAILVSGCAQGTTVDVPPGAGSVTPPPEDSGNGGGGAPPINGSGGGASPPTAGGGSGGGSAAPPDPFAPIVPMVAGLANDPFPTFGVSVNNYRSPDLNPLAYNAKLQGAAQTHANDMATNNFFSHTGSDGSQVWDRVLRQGYNYQLVGENIATGFATAADALQGWKDSPSHNGMLLHSTPTEFGLAYSAGNNWVMVLAKPQP